MKAWIYFARFGSEGPIKIGRTGDLRSRIRNLDCGSPFRVVLLGAMQSVRAEEEEHEIHLRLQRHCVRGEWFEAEAALHEMRSLDKRVLSFEELKRRQAGTKRSAERRDSRLRIRISQHVYKAMAEQADREYRAVSDILNNILAERFPALRG